MTKITRLGHAACGVNELVKTAKFFRLGLAEQVGKAAITISGVRDRWIRRDEDNVSGRVRIGVEAAVAEIRAQPEDRSIGPPASPDVTRRGAKHRSRRPGRR